MIKNGKLIQNFELSCAQSENWKLDLDTEKPLENQASSDRVQPILGVDWTADYKQKQLSRKLIELKRPD